MHLRDDRPQPDWSIPAIPLIYHGFGVFTDIVTGTKDATAAIQSLKPHVDMFASTMAQSHVDQVARRDAALHHLNKIYDVFKLPNLDASAIGHAVSDGHNTSPHGTLLTIIQVNNGPVDFRIPPDVQALADVALNHTKMSNEELLSRWRIPTLGINIVGECPLTLLVNSRCKGRCRIYNYLLRNDLSSKPLPNGSAHAQAVLLPPGLRRG
jgi:hypothetical protein